MIHLFEDCELDPGRFQLRRGGKIVHLEPKVFDVLAYLLGRREQVVTKLELLEALWPGETVSESVLPRAVAAARRAVGDTRGSARVIETVHGRGYRFVAAVEERGGASTTSPAPPGVGAPPESAAFVGRERALAALESALRAAFAGEPRVALLAGEPGIGKTRTLEEFARNARARGARVAFGRGFEGDGAPAFWPWRQLLRELGAAIDRATLGAAVAGDADDLAQIAPELREAGSTPRAAPPAAGEHARFRLLDALAGLLGRLAHSAPLVLVLDDLHWADESSLLALRFLARELREARVLILGAYRDVEVRRTHPLARTLGALARDARCERVVLRGLDPHEVGSLASAVAGRALDPVLARRIHDTSAGNPFFVFEIARSLREVSAAPESPLALPQSVRDAIGRRLDTLSPEANELLRAGAVLGRPFDASLLGRIAGVDPEAALDAIGEALDAGVLCEADARGTHYGFAHALVRQTLYEELRAPQRARLHHCTAEALEASVPTGEEPPLSEISHHRFEALPAGDAGLAIDAAERAAAAAHTAFAYEESARLCEQGLEALAASAPRDAQRRFALLSAAGGAYVAAGERERAREKFRAAAQVARASRRPDWLARAAIGMRGIGEMGVPPEADTLALLEEARDVLGSDDAALRARLLAKLTGAAPHALSMATRDALSREAMALARASGDVAALNDALAARHWACFGPERVEERLAIGAEQIALGERARDPLIAFNGHETLFGAHLLLGDPAAADGALAHCRRIAGEQRMRLIEFQARSFAAARSACAGDLPAAQRAFAEALEVGRGRVPYAQLQCDAQQLWIELQRGGRGSLAGGTELLRTIGSNWAGADGVAACAGALVALGQGQAGEARRVLDDLGANGFARLERNEHFLLAVAILADLVFALGDAPRAAQLHALLSPHAHLFALHDLLRTFAGSVAAVLGELSLTLGRCDEAIVRYEAGLAFESRAGARAAQVSSRVGLARALRKRAAPGDARRATSLLREVAATAPALGIDWTERFGFDPATLAERPSRLR